MIQEWRELELRDFKGAFYQYYSLVNLETKIFLLHLLIIIQ